MANVEIDQKSIQNAIAKIRLEYSHVSGDILDKAISRALNRATQQGKTFVNREIRRVYNISSKTVNESLSVRYSTGSNLTSMIIAKGSPLSLNHFQAKQITPTVTTSFDRKGTASSRLTRKSRTNAAKGVTAMIKKGETINLPTAFIQYANGGITVFARGKYKSKSEGFEFGKERLPIGKMSTLSIPMMMIQEDVLRPLGNAVSDFFEKRIDHEIDFLLR